MFRIAKSVLGTIQIVQDKREQQHRSSLFNFKCFSVDLPPAAGWDALLLLGSFTPVCGKVSSDILPVQFWLDLPIVGTISVQFQFGSKGFAVTSWVFVGHDV